MLLFRAAERAGWHRWFAWHPVYAGAPERDSACQRLPGWVWLETVERRRIDDGGWGSSNDWTYRRLSAHPRSDVEFSRSRNLG